MKPYYFVAAMIVAAPAVAQNPPAKTGQGVGVVTAIDTKATKVTIQHGPIPAVGWPAMTMTFRVSPLTLLNAVRVGQTVRFVVRTRGMDAVITGIKPR